jgi:hypothetical protein
LLWFGQVISVAGDWVLFAALPFYVYSLTGSALATGAMFMIATLPRVLLGSVAGVLRQWLDGLRLMRQRQTVATLLVVFAICMIGEGLLYAESDPARAAALLQVTVDYERATFYPDVETHAAYVRSLLA